jgi:hypothetical protein
MDHVTGAATVIAQPDLDELLERAKAGKPPDLDPVGQCPYCHYDLVKREIHQQRDLSIVPIGGPLRPLVLLVFWACTNEECCLMFWQHPRVTRWVPPIADDLLEH